ncbi:MAG: hypothetical protein P8H31_00425 [Porticoccaceae bacterium]|nr:hypothetical protein [Porticoccaceae bacterium]
MYRAFFLDELDERRFGVPLLDNLSYQAIYFEKPFSVLSNKFESCSSTFIFGARPIDFWALKIAVKTSDKVYVLQHATNSISRSHSYKFFWQNRVKLFKWITFIFFVQLKLLRYFRDYERCGEIIILFHTDQFLGDIEPKVKKLNIPLVTRTKLSDPCPLVWGAESIISVDDSPIMAFYVDEPLNQTLGIDVCEEQILLLKLLEILPVGQVHVKLHPRSIPTKYDFCDRFKVVEAIFKDCNYLIGYRSGLLNYSFTRRFDCRLEDMNWVISPAPRNDHGCLDYVSEASDVINEK